MKEIIVETKLCAKVFNLPTTIDEIDGDYLNYLTEHVKVADEYTLVGVVYHQSLSNIMLATKKQNQNIGVIPIYIKSGNTTSEFIESANVKDTLTIAGTQLQLAHKPAVPNNDLALAKFMTAITEGTKEWYQSAYTLSSKDEELMFVEFKIVPNCDIIAINKEVNKRIDTPYYRIIPNGVSATV